MIRHLRVLLAITEVLSGMIVGRIQSGWVGLNLMPSNSSLLYLLTTKKYCVKKMVELCMYAVRMQTPRFSWNLFPQFLFSRIFSSKSPFTNDLNMIHWRELRCTRCVASFDLLNILTTEHLTEGCTLHIPAKVHQNLKAMSNFAWPVKLQLC